MTKGFIGDFGPYGYHVHMIGQPKSKFWLLWLRDKWEILVDIKVHDVKDLARQGLFFGPENLDQTAVTHELSSPSNTNSGWTYCRSYPMVCKLGTPWLGKFKVLSTNPTTAESLLVRPSDKIHISYMTVYDSKDTCVFYYDSATPEACFNHILDTDHLAGWWPWPKDPPMVLNAQPGTLGVALHWLTSLIPSW